MTTDRFNRSPGGSTSTMSWSPTGHPHCARCQTTERRHFSRGLCYACYVQQWELRPVRQAADDRLSDLVDRVIGVVCSYYDLHRRQLIQRARGTPEEAQARQVLCYLLVEDLGLGLTAVGRLIARDHSSVAHAVDAVRALIDTRKRWAAQVEDLREEIARLHRAEIGPVDKRADAVDKRADAVDKWERIGGGQRGREANDVFRGT